MPRRGTLTQAEKDERRKSKQTAKDDALAANALAALPRDKEKRLEPWQERDRLRAEAKETAAEANLQVKRLHKVHGLTKATIRIRDILAGLSQGQYEATIKQLPVVLDDLDRPFQLDLALDQVGKGVVEDEGSVFDQTAAGQAQAAERTDDPAKARKRPGKAPKAVEAAPAPSIPLSEAEAAFSGDVRPRFLKDRDNPLPGAEGQGSYRIVN